MSSKPARAKKNETKQKSFHTIKLNHLLQTAHPDGYRNVGELCGPLQRHILVNMQHVIVVPDQGIYCAFRNCKSKIQKESYEKGRSKGWYTGVSSVSYTNFIILVLTHKNFR